MLEVSFFDAARAFEDARDELTEACARVLGSGALVLGPEVAAFEDELAARLGVPAIVGVASGTDAIELALRALDLPPGGEVICPALTSNGSAMAILRAGFEPVLVDVDEETLVLDPASALAAAGPRTAAILTVHLYGRGAPVTALAAAGVPVVEDCAQAIGLRLAEGSAGGVGAAGCFSFYPTKNLGAFGDAGAVATADPERGERLRELRSYSERPRYHAVAPGVNSRLDELQAALLRVRLRRLDAENLRRAAIAARYDEALGVVSPPGTHHLYLVRSERRDALRAFLADRGVQTLVHYPWTLDQQPAFAACRRSGRLDAAHRAVAEIVSLPCYAFLSDIEVEAVAAALEAAAGNGLVRSALPGA